MPNMLEHILDQIHTSITRRWYLQVFTAFTRILLAVGFIPPSWKKIMHEPFTQMPDTNPVGAYFIALFNTGYYYEFIGWSQMIAAVLLLFPRTAHIGALLFLPIIINIAVLTNSVGFNGTWLVTILMSLAGAWLVAWEYDRLKPILFFTRARRPRRSLYGLFLIPLAFAVAGAALGVLLWVFRIGNLPYYVYMDAMLAVVGAGFGIIVAVHYRFMRVGRLSESHEQCKII